MNATADQISAGGIPVIEDDAEGAGYGALVSRDCEAYGVEPFEAPKVRSLIKGLTGVSASPSVVLTEVNKALSTSSDEIS